MPKREAKPPPKRPKSAQERPEAPTSVPERPTSAPRAPQERPRAPKCCQNPKTALNRAQIATKTNFYVLLSLSLLKSNSLSILFAIFPMSFMSPTLNFIGFLEGKRYFFKNRIFGKNHGKTLPKHSQIPPQTSQNPVKNHSENAKKRNFEASCEKNAKKCDLGANLERTWRPKAKNNPTSMVLDGIRDALSEELRSTKRHGTT